MILKPFIYNTQHSTLRKRKNSLYWRSKTLLVDTYNFIIPFHVKFPDEKIFFFEISNMIMTGAKCGEITTAKSFQDIGSLFYSLFPLIIYFLICSRTFQLITGKLTNQCWFLFYFISHKIYIFYFLSTMIKLYNLI